MEQKRGRRPADEFTLFVSNHPFTKGHLASHPNDVAAHGVTLALHCGSHGLGLELECGFCSGFSRHCGVDGEVHGSI